MKYKIRKIMPDKACQKCGTSFSPRTNQLFCSAACRESPDGRRRLFNIGITKGTAGAICELEVCGDLLRKEYAVYRAVSPSCKCDLVAVKNGKTVRVEVATGYINKDGTVKCPTSKTTDRTNGHVDVIALCTTVGITYIPELP